MTNKNELTFEMSKIQLTGPLLGLALVAMQLLPYFVLHGLEELKKILSFFGLAVFIPSIIVGIIIHEFIHGFTWSRMAKISLKKIKFGFQLKTLTPYAHSTVPMNAKAYRFGAVMPLLILGILPYVVALITKQPMLLGFGVFFSFVATGDILILWIIRKLPPHQLIQDHPTKAGVILFEFEGAKPH